MWVSHGDCGQEEQRQPGPVERGDHVVSGQYFQHDMISPLDRPRLTLLLLATITMGHPHCGPVQRLALTADVGKSVFFEDEPIFLVLRLKNVGSDILWLSNTVEVSVRRRDAAPVPVAGWWSDR